MISQYRHGCTMVPFICSEDAVVPLMVKSMNWMEEISVSIFSNCVSSLFIGKVWRYQKFIPIYSSCVSNLKKDKTIENLTNFHGLWLIHVLWSTNVQYLDFVFLTVAKNVWIIHSNNKMWILEPGWHLPDLSDLCRCQSHRHRCDRQGKRNYRRGSQGRLELCQENLVGDRTGRSFEGKILVLVIWNLGSLSHRNPLDEGDPIHWLTISHSSWWAISQWSQENCHLDIVKKL